MRRLLMLFCVLVLAGCAGLGLLEKPQVALAGMENSMDRISRSYRD